MTNAIPLRGKELTRRLAGCTHTFGLRQMGINLSISCSGGPFFAGSAPRGAPSGNLGTPGNLTLSGWTDATRWIQPGRQALDLRQRGMTYCERGLIVSRHKGRRQRRGWKDAATEEADTSHRGDGVVDFWAVRPSSSLMIWAKLSYAWAPDTSLPLMKNPGVPVTPKLVASWMSLSISDRCLPAERHC